MSEVAPKAEAVGAALSIFIGVLSWIGAHLPQFVQGATFVLTMILIIKNVRAYFKGHWDRKE